MSSYNRVSKIKRTVAARELTVSDGVRQYLSESGLTGIVAAAALYCVANIVLLTVETLDGGGWLCYLQTIAAVLLLAGSLCTLVGSRLRFSPIGIAVTGLIISALGIAVLSLGEIVAFFTEYSVLGFIQRVVTLVLLGACMTIAVFLLLACNNKAPLSGVGVFPSAVGVVALIMLLVRTMVSFASVKTELGNAWNWALAEKELYAEVVWILRSVPAVAPSAARMFGVRLAERISAIILIASSLGFFFKYKGFFEHFNRNLSYIREIPVRSVSEEQRYDDPSDLSYFGAMSGISTRSRRREERYDEIYDPREERYDEIYDPHEERYDEIYDPREERYDEIYDPREERYDEPYYPREQAEQQAAQQRRRLSGYTSAPRTGQPSYGAEAAVPSPEQEAPKQPVKVKVSPLRPSVPDPDSEGFWDSYTH